MDMNLDQQELKTLIKSPLVEVLREERGLLSDALEDAIEDIGLARAIGEGIETPEVSREDIFDILEDTK